MNQKMLIISDIQISTNDKNTIIENISEITNEIINNKLLDYAFGNIHPIIVMTRESTNTDFLSKFGLQCIKIQY